MASARIRDTGQVEEETYKNEPANKDDLQPGISNEVRSDFEQ